MDRQVDSKKIISGVALIAVFLFREGIAWFLGELLKLLPIPRDAQGNIDVSAVPWLDIVGWVVFIAGICLVLFGAIGRQKQNGLPSDSGGREGAGSSTQSAVDQTVISSVVDRRFEEFLATTLRAEFATHAHLHRYDERMIEIADMAKNARSNVETTFDFASK